MKKIISVILSLIILLSFVPTTFAAESAQIDLLNLFESKDSFKKFIRKNDNLPEGVKDSDISIDMFETLSDGKRLVKYHINTFAYTALLYTCNIDKYIYSYGSSNEAYIYYENKLYSIKKAWESDIISKKVFSEVRGYIKSIKPNKITMKAGGKDRELYCFNGPGVDSLIVPSSPSVSDTKVLKKNRNGTFAPLTKGTAIVTVWYSNGKSVSAEVKVTTNPKLSVKSVKVKKNGTVKVKITGKANSVDNKYKNTKYAAVTSKKSSKTLSVKGLKKGKTTLKITVNGKKLSLKVNVV